MPRSRPGDSRPAGRSFVWALALADFGYGWATPLLLGGVAHPHDDPVVVNVVVNGGRELSPEHLDDVVEAASLSG